MTQRDPTEFKQTGIPRISLTLPCVAVKPCKPYNLAYTEKAPLRKNKE